MSTKDGMIRFRLGQRWKRERGGAPLDSLGLEMDGLDLLGGQASEEPLAEVVPELVSAVHALWAGGEPVGQISLPESHLELALLRRDAEAELSIVSLGRPAALARRVTVELGALAEAVAKCGRTLGMDLRAAAPSLSRASGTKRMLEQADALEDAGPVALRRPYVQNGYGYRRFAVEPVAFGFELVDDTDRLLAVDPRMRAPLPSLLSQGSVWLSVEREEVWRVKGVPFLLALELSRQAAELTHALELGDRRFSLAAGSGGPKLEVRLSDGKLAVGGRTLPVEPERLVRAMLELGLELAFAAQARNPAQGKNPYLMELTARCREGLSHVRQAPQPPSGPKAVERERPPNPTPLSKAGKVRRLRFETLWDRDVGDEEAGTLLLGMRGPIVAAPHQATVLSASGEVLFRRKADHGVAISREGIAVCAEADRVLCYRGAEKGARWLRNHDGLPVGPVLQRRQGLLITTSERRAAVAFDELTGREIWRVAPVRVKRLELSVQGHRALLTTDAGYLLALDLHDGQARYRARATLPFLWPTVAWGRRWVAVLGRRERCSLLSSDAHSGEGGWSVELQLSMVSPALASGGRLAVAGERNHEGLIACFGPKGRLLWERALHLGHGPFRLLSVGRGILVTSSTGAATL
ncbi:MAG TPA: PQQ-binding-like beta-propeller repeat protein, partial [Longimicrobium sp.]|nr:PQQ-binding-like beta-propeller repeat protein [Longimicrobium sp.]